MRFANPHPPRRGAFLLIALFSCLQILFGFFLFTENGHDSVLQAHNPVQLASYKPAPLSPKTLPEHLNAIETASGHEQPETLHKKSRTSAYFREYQRQLEKRIEESNAARRHAALKKHMQQKHVEHTAFSDNGK